MNTRHGKRAQDYGCDAVIATSNEAAAHGEAVAGMVLVPHIVDHLDMPVIAAGVIADGRNCRSSRSRRGRCCNGNTFHDYKGESTARELQETLVEKSVTDTVHTPRVDGIFCRVLDSAATLRQ